MEERYFGFTMEQLRNRSPVQNRSLAMHYLAQMATHRFNAFMQAHGINPNTQAAINWVVNMPDRFLPMLLKKISLANGGHTFYDKDTEEESVFALDKKGKTIKIPSKVRAAQNVAYTQAEWNSKQDKGASYGIKSVKKEMRDVVQQPSDKDLVPGKNTSDGWKY